MSEEEIIKQIKNDIDVGEFYDVTKDAVKGLLNLYINQKDKITHKIEELKKLPPDERGFVTFKTMIYFTIDELEDLLKE